MNAEETTGLFVAEGSSDAPIGEIVESLFLDRGINLRLARPDFGLLDERVRKDLTSRLDAGTRLLGSAPDVVVFHRDVDNTDSAKRREEMEEAIAKTETQCALVPVIPIRMTEAWLLLDEQAIRTVAGNPNGNTRLNLPKLREVERVADPKQRLHAAILAAADVKGRRRERLASRFDASRRQLLERLDVTGRVGELASWKALISDIDRAVEILGAKRS